MKIKKSSLVTLIIFILLFQGILSSKLFSPIGYADEIITIFGILYIMASVKRKYRETYFTFAAFAALILIGIISSLFSDIHIDAVPRILDAFSFSKFIVLFWFGIYLGESRYSNISKWKFLGTVVRGFVQIAFCFCIINLFVNIHMHTDYRYGLRSFNFIFDRVGGLYSACACFLAIQTVDIHYNGSSKKKRIFLVMTVIVMCSTLRARAFAFATMYYAGYAIFVLNKKYKFKFRHVLFVLLGGGIIAYPQIRYYLIDNETQARARLIRYGIETAISYFPYGSGLSTYGTFQAKQVKSPLYVRYGFDRFYGLGLVKNTYITDNFWPAVMAEFGFLGLIIMLIILSGMTRFILRSLKTRRMLLFAVLFIWLSVFASSIATASYINATTEMLVMGIIIGESLKKDKEAPKYYQNLVSERLK